MRIVFMFVCGSAAPCRHRSCAMDELVTRWERLIMKDEGALRRSEPTDGLLCAELFTSANDAEMIVK